MKFRLTILNSAAFLFLTGCLLYGLLNYSNLTTGEGWGMIYIIGLFFFGLTALVADLIIRIIFKTKSSQNIAGIIALLLYIVLYYLGT